MSSLLKGPGSTKFADRWPDMQPVVLKLLKQEHVTRDEWQNLFWLGQCIIVVPVSYFIILTLCSYVLLYMFMPNTQWCIIHNNVDIHVLHATPVCVCVCVRGRDVHSVCSWDEKAAVRIQDALRNEILRFISEAQGVSIYTQCIYTHIYRPPSLSLSLCPSLPPDLSLPLSSSLSVPLSLRIPLSFSLLKYSV